MKSEGLVVSLMRKASDLSCKRVLCGCFMKPNTSFSAFSFLQHWNEYKKKKDETGFAKLLESCDSATLGRLFSTPMLEADMVCEP